MVLNDIFWQDTFHMLRLSINVLTGDPFREISVSLVACVTEHKLAATLRGGLEGTEHHRVADSVEDRDFSFRDHLLILF